MQVHVWQFINGANVAFCATMLAFGFTPWFALGGGLSLLSAVICTAREGLFE